MMNSLLTVALALLTLTGCSTSELQGVQPVLSGVVHVAPTPKTEPTSTEYRFMECGTPAKANDVIPCTNYTVTVTGTRAYVEVIGYSSEWHTDCRFDATVLPTGALRADNTDRCDLIPTGEVAFTLIKRLDGAVSLRFDGIQSLLGSKELPPQ